MTRALHSVMLASTCLLACLAARTARAQQFVLVDLAYTHSADTTKDSHYYPQLPADTPKDWTKPVDYAHGSVHIILDVKTKPAGEAPTKYQLCFEGTPSYGCTVQSPTYTKTGKLEWDSPFSSFWYDGTVDWTMGVKQMPMILKDDMNNKPAGDPKYVPTDLHVYVALVPAGAKFVPPSAAGSGGGGAGAGRGGADAGRGGAGEGGGASGAGMSGASAGRNAAGSGGGAAAGKDASGGAGAAAGSGMTAGKSAAIAGDAAGSGGRPSQVGAAGATGESAPALDKSSGCSSAGAPSGAASWPWLAALVLAWSQRRRALRH